MGFDQSVDDSDEEKWNEQVPFTELPEVEVWIRRILDDLKAQELNCVNPDISEDKCKNCDYVYKNRLSFGGCIGGI